MYDSREKEQSSETMRIPADELAKVRGEAINEFLLLLSLGYRPIAAFERVTGRPGTEAMRALEHVAIGKSLNCEDSFKS
jgi:hypothetical protein